MKPSQARAFSMASFTGSSSKTQRFASRHLPQPMQPRIAFVRCVREDGADALASYLAANEAQGLLYHRDTVHFTGDYDISEDEAEILRLLREGSKP